jgi:hypothetical protein
MLIFYKIKLTPMRHRTGKRNLFKVKVNKFLYVKLLRPNGKESNMELSPDGLGQALRRRVNHRQDGVNMTTMKCKNFIARNF